MPNEQMVANPEPALGSFERHNLLINQTREVLQVPS